MANMLMNIPNDNAQNYPFFESVDYNLWLKHLTLNLMNQPIKLQKSS